MIFIKHSRAFAGAALLLLMFALGIALVTLFKRQPPSPQAQQQAPPPVLPPQKQEPQTPSEVVETYWRLSAEGDIDGANRYWSVVGRTGDVLVKLNAVRADWAVVINGKRWKLDKVEKEVLESDNSAYVIVKLTSDREPPALRLVNELVKVKGEWKIVSIEPRSNY